MSNHLIDLVCPGEAVGCIQLMLAPPIAKHLKADPERKRRGHAKSHKNHPVNSVLCRRRFRVKNNAAVALLNGIGTLHRVAYGTPGGYLWYIRLHLQPGSYEK